jgi:hypothetical protein
VALLVPALLASGASAGNDGGTRAAVPPGAIKHVIVIDLENESFDSTFGPNSPAVYLNQVLLKQGELIPNYYATSHVSLGNYVSQVSGQATTPSTNNDCLNFSNPAHIVGTFTNVTPGTDAGAQFPGQVVGDGCVFPGPTSSSHGAQTIGDQLEARHGSGGPHLTWREYAQDMGDVAARDGGTPDPLGGTTCAHPTVGGADMAISAAPADQYATRHDGFVYFHSVIDNQAYCDTHVVPLGTVTVTVGVNGAADTFSGHLAQDLAKDNTTPTFSFISPNLCNDGHDAICTGTNTEGGKAGGLIGADLWLKHWMPLIFDSPAYRNGKTLVVVTFDEASVADARACCGEQGGPNLSNPGFSPLLAFFHVQTPPAPGTFPYPGGGQVGAVVFNSKYVTPGSVNHTGFYNHYSALRSYEDVLGITSGGDDGHGHLGFAGAPGLVPFGPDVFNARS